jgi:zinc transport system ATP-binding protein
MNKLIEIQNMSFAYENKPILRNVSLTIYEKDFLGIIGPNGGGKTTLIKTILRLKKPQEGRILYYRDGKETDNIKLGYLPQYNALDRKFPISAQEVILSGLSSQKSLFKHFTKAHYQKVEEVIEKMGLEKVKNQPIGQLSGGQFQRTLLGRAIVSDPDVVILDEPNTYIDKKFEAKLYELLNEINKERAIVLVSHDIGTVLQNVKSIACVNETLDYHPDTQITEEWLEQKFNCPIELLGHGTLPHRILKEHEHHNDN